VPDKSNPDRPAPIGASYDQRYRLDGLSPDQRERVARWIEAKCKGFQRAISQAQAWLMAHGDDAAEIAKLAYYRNAMSVAKQLAYLARTEKPRHEMG
jgi:hypothetical protein